MEKTRLRTRYGDAYIRVRSSCIRIRWRHRGFPHACIRERGPVIGSQPLVVSAKRMFSNVQINSLGRRGRDLTDTTDVNYIFLSFFLLFSGARWGRLTSIFASYIVRSRDDGFISCYQLPTICARDLLAGLSPLPIVVCFELSVQSFFFFFSSFT